ncbi:SDR family oxidoreductase [Flavobacterium circumlabens]|uniref:NADP-dependent 3-hydroxy acid dehydrogenase YdfG n=1 Tax=Flavobacterium circumlabens TaxID=2133765 RepID=A0A4Y7UG49_9FLAO|nr:SDR family oxidoreductase [Flavobacterium circumlabens]TCN59537.1 NADP-dependent 3-hydroxy acid dehydrogenase YdfG [Flavobacterium circumlabens]TEB44829.1 SDR family oxidoreductase [Flavobacterium circumlabens]
MSKTILITGASTGIGKLTAIYFSQKGWNVSATMRTIEKGQDLLKYPNLKIFRLDVTDDNSIRQAIDSTILAFGQIDVLFNNAGYALVGAFEAMGQEQIKKQFDTNVFGVMNVTKAILPHFRGNKKGTIINTTSMGGLITFPLYSVYHSTKWALEGFTESLQFELKPFNIRMKNIEPGAIRTEFENAIDYFSTSEYDNYTSRAHQNMLDNYKTAPTAEIVAKKVWHAANDTSYRLRYAVGGQGPLLLFMRWLLPLSWFTKIVTSAVEKGIKQ